MARSPDPHPLARPWLGRTAYALIALTGAAGLAYQVTWHRYLTRLVGSDALAVATVLGVFLGGLALGYYLCGALATRTRNPLRAYALLEAAIALWGLSFPALFRFVERATADWAFEPPWGLLVQGALSGAVLLVPPTLCMGATVPLLTHGFGARAEKPTAVLARVYGANTGGACAGALVSGFVLVPLWGLPGTLRAAACANAAAAAFFWFAAPARTLERAGPAPRAGAVETPAPALTHAIAFLAGFYFLTLETLVIRITGLSLGSSAYAFALVVAAMILAIAVGAASVARRRAIAPTTVWHNQLAACLALAALFATLDKWPWAAHLLRIQLGTTKQDFVVFHVLVFAALSLLCLLPFGLMGATLPLLFHRLRADGLPVGTSCGRLFAWNAAGNMLGALVGGVVAYRVLGNGEVFLAATALVGVSAALATVGLGARCKAGAAALLVGCGLLAVTFPFDPLRFAVGTFRLRESLEYSYRDPATFYREFYRTRTVLAYRDEPQGTYAVIENPEPLQALQAKFPDLARSILGEMGDAPRFVPRSIMVNGKSDSSTFYDLETLKLSAHVPALLTGRRDRVLVIGLGTGVTAGELALYRDVGSIAVVEISPTVVEFLPYFDDSNYRIREEPRLELRVGDAFRVIRRSGERWDIISSEPSNPWMSGVDQLFSREFYRLAREHLAEGGVFVQWFQRYATSEAIASVVLNTVRSEFPHVAVFRSGGDDLILGSEQPLTAESFARADGVLSENAEVARSLRAIGVGGAVDLRRRVDPDAIARADRHTALGAESLDRPRLHYMAGLAFFEGDMLDRRFVVPGG